MLRCLPFLAALALAACGRAVPVETPQHPSAPPREPARAGAPGPSAKLVIAVVIDQLPSWALPRYERLLYERGALRSAMTRGAYYEQARYDFAGTYTAPGHATLFTGVEPRLHGIVANEIWDPARSKVVSVVDDGKTPVFGTSDQFVSPRVLRAATVADELERQTSGQAITASISLKDRAAVLPGGKQPDLALFYDSKRGVFTTSRHYADEPPAWLALFQANQPLERRLAAWEPGDPALLEALLGPDAQSGESDWKGFGTTFPHHPGRTAEPLTAVRATPIATDYLFDLAEEAVRALGMGEDAVPDLLMLSISPPDYAGHLFGPESWEYADSLARTDRALTRFLGRLAYLGSVAVLVTSDHGVAPLPERSLDRSRLALRVPTKKIARDVNLELAGRFGVGELVASYTEPFVYLTPFAKNSPAYPRILDAVASEIAKTPGVAAVFAVRDVLRGEPDTELARLVRASVTDDATADLFVVPCELCVVDPTEPGGTGTSHGSPWLYDRLVPVLFWGPEVVPTRSADPVPITGAAATLSALLGIAPPPGAAPALVGVRPSP